MPLEEPIEQIKNLERRIVELETKERTKELEKGFQLKEPIDTFSKKIIEDISGRKGLSRARVHGSASQGFAANTNTTITFNTDSGDYAYDYFHEWNTSSYYFEPNNDGYFLFMLFVNWTASVQDSEGFTLGLFRQREGSTVSLTENKMNSSRNNAMHSQSLAYAIHLKAKDKVWANALHDSTGNWRGFSHAGFGAHNYLAIHRLS